MKSHFIIIFLCAHLFVIILGSVIIPFGKYELGNAAELLDIYSSWTGGGHGYSFFSPDVGYQNVAKVFILTENDSLIIEAFGGNKTHLDARISTFIHSAYNIKIYELNARLISAYIFGIYPEAKVVKVSLGKYTVPDLQEYAKNPKATFVDYYEGIYNRVHPKPSE